MCAYNAYEVYNKIKRNSNIACYEKINIIVPPSYLNYVNYHTEEECQNYKTEGSGIIFYPYGNFNAKFIIRKLIYWPFLLDYPQVQNGELIAYILDPVMKRVCELHTRDRIASFRKALIEIHNKNISKNYRILLKNVPGIRLKTF